MPSSSDDVHTKDAHEDQDTGEEGLPIVLGTGVGDIVLGMTYAEVKAIYGDVDTVSIWNRMGTARYSNLGIELVFSSSENTSVSDDAVVVAIGALISGEFIGDVIPLMSLNDVVTKYGEAHLTHENRVYFKDGFAAELDPEGTIIKLAIVPTYEFNSQPPMMEYSTTTPVTDFELPVPRPSNEGEYEIVDVHLHTGEVENQTESGMEAIIEMLPMSSRLYYFGSNPAVLKPYAPHTGIKAQTQAAGVRHAVLLATYAQNTVSYTTNRGVETLLTDPQNTNQDGTPWAWGMVSINLDDLDNEMIFQERLAAMASYLENRPDLFIGIKLAHAHQQVAFDDARHHAIFDVAGAHAVPVLLHTGFSPFPGTVDDPDFYDPIALEISIQEYDGHQGKPRVDFILAHAGKGDQRSVDNALYLAATYDNVWLEISALGTAVMIDSHGDDVISDTAQYVEIFQRIKLLGIEDKVIFASDGPQYSGMVKTYLDEIVTELKRQDFSDEAIRNILAGNFYRCFFDTQ